MRKVILKIKMASPIAGHYTRLGYSKRALDKFKELKATCTILLLCFSIIYFLKKNLSFNYI